MENSHDKELDFVVRHYRKGRLDTSAAIARFNASHLYSRIHRKVSRSAAIAAVSAAAVLLAGVFAAVRIYYGTWVELSSSDMLMAYVLPDSTSVTLAPGSSVRYRKYPAFSRNRSVEMDGKVFFSVKRDTDHPFEITAGGSYVKVLGTEFHVELAPDGTSEVCVSSGKVFFARDDVSRGLVLTEGMAAKIGEGDAVPESIDAGPNPSVWATGVFEYENTPVSEVLDELSSYYSVELGLGSDTDKSLTGRFEAGDLDEILDVIDNALDIEIIKGK